MAGKEINMVLVERDVGVAQISDMVIYFLDEQAGHRMWVG